MRIALTTFMASSVLLAGAAAGQDASGIVQAVPANVTEVTTGGAWTNGDQTGAFRAIVVTGGESGPQVSVYVQLLAFAKTGAVASVLKTTPIKEVTDRKLQNAFVNFDAEAENKATLIITSYDAAKDTDNSIYAEVTADGAYKVIEPPKEEAAGPAAKK